MSEKLELPEGVSEEHLNYLDGLRERGDTNMFGAAPYVEQFFDVDRRAARKIVQFWMETFALRHHA